MTTEYNALIGEHGYQGACALLHMEVEALRHANQENRERLYKIQAATTLMGEIISALQRDDRTRIWWIDDRTAALIPKALDLLKSI